jgi:hypothetical protein
MIVPLHGGEGLDLKSNGAGSTMQFDYMLVGYESLGTAEEALEQYVPGSLSLRTKILALDSCKVDHIEADVYHGSAKYIDEEAQKEEQQQEGDAPQWSFDITGQTVHQTHGFAVRDAFPAGTAKDLFRGAINVDRDTKGNLKIGGVDVEVPLLGFSLDVSIRQPSNPPEFARTLCRAMHKTNSATWYGFSPGEVLFRGARVSGKLRGKWQMQYQFAASENINVNIPGIGNIPKRGFDYLWVHSKPKIDNTDEGDLLVPAAYHVFTHIMYDEFDFRQLGIGG